MKANRLIWPALAMMLIAALAIPSHALADDDGDSDLLLEQLTQFNGGCPPNPVEEPGGCIDVQFAIHRAPNCIDGPNAELGIFVGTVRYSFSMVRKFADPGDPPPIAGGSSTLVRAGDGVSTTLTTTELAPNAPYTMWWVGFNPDNPCVDDCNCSGDDLDGAIDSVIWATGAVSDILGSATFTANVEYGEKPDGEDQIPFAPAFDNGIEEDAEIHFVIRAHGPALSGGDDDD